MLWEDQVKVKVLLFIPTLFMNQVMATDLLKLYEEDQAARTHLQSLPEHEVRKFITEVMLPADKIRLAQVEEKLNMSETLSSREYLAAAVIMQHGSEPAHYKKAMELSQKAVALDPANKDASWLSCAAEDRYLMKIGQPQVWGTQLDRKMNNTGTYEIHYLDNFDKTARTDEQRKKCGIPSLAEMESKLEKMAKLESRSAQYKLWKTGT